MLLNKNSDQNVLFDLEFRGIDSFLSDLRSGINVPKSMIPQIKKIVKNYYEIDLKSIKTNRREEKGCFCGIEYKDEEIFKLKNID